MSADGRPKVQPWKAEASSLARNSGQSANATCQEESDAGEDEEHAWQSAAAAAAAAKQKGNAEYQQARYEQAALMYSVRIPAVLYVAADCLLGSVQ